ncbi:fatty acid elongase, putative [Plasmodium knowlesi strain H]|uniref:Elongation of fatty acids protein n=3 Tax=Plasmodium knowlesi TaxID=5850 RepID=A0A5K1UKV3_PLAKH|nr:fatty acid elongase, putative [Plasmodium knowlesi strain H]OTN67418.1 Elongation of fatty acids protein [Plasmodium knowlesi]CAA9987470.1 fatty acid elongase, putative [Plasmodium knowlesi strain H]SBO23214.1 fatty acid elongase, putative [Plasmodium knowlesi strain H]SBO24009.1 fatty acid elongase, putative [Plasmodium knowlesi strain H]VVS76944.1 fatty acid elongase, putative [Plasmodium knowlesi strain H]|eukprot:XP_002258471.1 fatty acid elongase, putative [Plasmodium knowlesi strain H]
MGGWSPLSRAFWVPGKGRELAGKYEKTILLISLLYIPVVLILQKVMRKRKEIEAKALKVAWNVCLSVFSLIGVLLILIYDPSVLKSIILEETEYKPETRAVISIFTLTKVVEYGDTIFLILKKKKLTFLHSYHHLSVVIYCLYSQKELVSHAHYFVFLNLVVHTIMYFYFGFIYIVPKILYKVRRFITCLQILQMFIGIFISYYAIKNVDNEIYVKNAIASLALYLTYAILFLNFYFNNYCKNVKSNVATYIISVHILGLIGLIMICTSNDTLRLFIEVSIGCVFTLTLLSCSFHFNTHYCNIWKNKIGDSNVFEQTDLFNIYKDKYFSNMAFLKKMTVHMIKTFLLCFNGLATYAHDTIFLFVNFYSERLKRIAHESAVMERGGQSLIAGRQLVGDFATKRSTHGNAQIHVHANEQMSGQMNVHANRRTNVVHTPNEGKNRTNKVIFLIKDLYNRSIISYIIYKSPIESISKNLESISPDQSVKKSAELTLLGMAKQVIQNYLLYIVCLILPIYYGLRVYNDALLGLCVHGALRWLIEIYSTKIFNKSHKLHGH